MYKFKWNIIISSPNKTWFDIFFFIFIQFEKALVARPNDGFMLQLQEFEKDLNLNPTEINEATINDQPELAHELNDLNQNILKRKQIE